MDQKPEINLVISFCQARNMTTCLHYKLKLLSLSLLVRCTQKKRFEGGLSVVSFPLSFFEAKVKSWEPHFG